MYIKPLFAPARSEYEEADVVILGVPLERSVSFRTGCRFAPGAIREASRGLEWYSYQHDLDLADVPICDMGDLDTNMPLNDLKRVLGGVIGDILRDGKLPVVIGGEHTISTLTVPSTGVDAAIILDAHLDLRDTYGGDRNSHATVSRRIAEVLGSENLVILGVRSGSKEEFEYAESEGVLYYTSVDLQSGVKEVIGELRSRLGERIYISLDMDVLDPSYAPAVSNPEPYGITPSLVRELILKLADRVAGFDIVEIAPPYDRGLTALLGARFIIDLIHSYMGGGTR
ncbi:MAG: agmatinase [Candidatus Syntrophoarchaeum butanivorans]|uniref:Agmatinase n=1 Tax=Candidatus Syntropharchaeum butanivorans TaxID=1839936 RepID=A0A1F2P3B3_9EURY|nr:MAG: agmatinase [Candidatus Syntrophoarchaeum butanivorans]